MLPSSYEKLERYRDIVPDFSAFIDALSRPLPRTLQANTLQLSVGELSQLFDEQAIAYQRIHWRDDALRLHGDVKPGNLIEYHAGLFHLQEEVSMLPVTVLAPQATDKICDLCAAPGSKTIQAAIAMKNRGTIIANDVNRERLTALRANMARLGIMNISTCWTDGCGFPIQADGFDKVICDAPCSGEGTCRKSAGALTHGLADGQPFRGDLQWQLLCRALKLVKPAGRVVYSTCSFRPEENEMVVDKVIREGRARLIPISIPGFNASSGLTQWGNAQLDPSLVGAMRVWPHQNDTGGFFLALLERTA